MSGSLSVIFIKHTNLLKLICGLKILHVRAAPNLCLFNALYVFPYKW